MHLTHQLTFLSFENYMLPCFTKQIFGLDCPGCGLQRSALFLVRGEFVEAFKMYPAIYPILLLFTFLILGKLFKIKYAGLLVNLSLIISVATILISYILKFL